MRRREKSRPVQYENDGLRVTFAGAWPTGANGMVPEPMGIVDVSETLGEGAAGQELGYAISVYFLPEIQRKVKLWGRTDVWHVLAYLMPVVDARVQFVIVSVDADLVSNFADLLPSAPVIEETEPDWFSKLTDIKDAARVLLNEGDIFVMRMGNDITPNQIREAQDYLQYWFDEQGLSNRVLVLPGEGIAVLEPEPVEAPRQRGKMTRIGSAWVQGWVTEAQARVQVGALHQEQLELARAGLKEGKTAPVEWWNDDERLAEPPAEVA